MAKTRNNKPILAIDYSEEPKKVKQFSSQREAAKHYKVSEAIISRHITNKSVFRLRYKFEVR